MQEIYKIIAMINNYSSFFFLKLKSETVQTVETKATNETKQRHIPALTTGPRSQVVTNETASETCLHLTKTRVRAFAQCDDNK